MYNNLIKDEETGLEYDPRYGRPRVHPCYDCSVNNYCSGGYYKCMKEIYESNPDKYYDPDHHYRIDYDDLLIETRNIMHSQKLTIQKLEEELKKAKLALEEFVKLETKYSQKIAENDPEYLEWKNYKQTGKWKK